MLGRAPYRIDILTNPVGVSWEEAWRGVVPASYGAQPIFVMGLDALIASKRAAARPRDLADIVELEAMKRKGRG